ncbi:MAG: c-type cytochrome [Sulfuricurvum sp.]|nr:c-type cytochrome [Sulfuricurvum sp.]
MKEFKILAVLVVLVGVLYYGIEPYAHSVMHPEVAPANFNFDDLKNVDTSIKGNGANGKVLVEANCIACHAIEKVGHLQLMPNADAAAAYGVTPPDLSHAGRIYDKNFLANFIFDPVSALHLEHKYPVGGAKTFPMPAYNWMSQQDIMDIVVYLQSIAPKVLDDKVGHAITFKAACGRCHSMKYGTLEATTPADALKTYMGVTPPDLSQHIKSRGEHYLHSFINNPQVLIKGTAMPRVGLTEKAQEEVIAYMEEIGDSKKEERETVGLWVMGYMVVFALLAYLWKRQIWKKVH